MVYLRHGLPVDSSFPRRENLKMPIDGKKNKRCDKLVGR